MPSQSRARSLQALSRISGQLEPLDDNLAQFYGRLSATVAELVGARRAGFFLLERDALSLQSDAFGIDASQAAMLRGIPCHPDGSSAIEGVVFRGQVLRAAPESPSADQNAEGRQSWLEAVGAREGLAVPWGAGAHRLGLAAAYDARAPGGFTDDDAWVLQVSATAAALVSQQRRLASRLLASTAEESERLRAVAERMGELEELKRHILNLAAHELRGPVAVVRGYLSMISDGSIDEQGLRRVLPILLGKAAQMDALITQMLEVARLEEGRLDLHPVTVDLGRIARETIDVAGLLAASGLTVFFERPPEPVLVHGDPARLTTIIGNLVDNALKYSPDGGLVRCSVGIAGGRAFVSVSDQGLGIAPEHLPNLFSRFGRIVTPQNSHIGGTGLGLHLSRELARLHTGDITVESAPGHGSEFTLWLPLQDSEAQSLE